MSTAQVALARTPTETVALSGQSAPGMPASLKYEKFELKPGIAANGSVVFISSLRDEFSQAAAKGIFAGQPGGLTLVAQAGAPVDGVTITDLLYTPVLDSAGHVAFAAVTSGGSGIFAGLPGQIRSVAQTGHPIAPDDFFTTFDVFPGAVAMNG
jgi:hypothetical protein